MAVVAQQFERNKDLLYTFLMPSTILAFFFLLNANISLAKHKRAEVGFRQSRLACLILIYLRVLKDLEIYGRLGENLFA